MNIVNLINNPSKDDAVRIGYLGQSGYVLKKGNTTILIDPYLSDYVEHSDGLNDQKMKRQFPPVIEPSDVRLIDAVFCSHTHIDHMDPWTLENIRAPFKLYCSEAAFNQNPTKLKKAQLDFLNWDESVDLMDIRITPIPAAHYHKADKNGNPDCLSFLITIQDKTLFFWSDGIPYDGLTDRLAKESFDIFFAPINGRDWFREKEGIVGNLNCRELAEICGKIDIDTVVPNHFDMFEYNSEIPAHFINYVNQICPNQKVKILNHGEIVTI